MSIYTEKLEKNSLKVSDSSNLVMFKVDCQYGTTASVAFYQNGLKKVRCGKEVTIGKASDLNGLTISFNGSSGNPGKGQIKIIHTFYEEGGTKLIYIFPDDYTGSPDFNEQDAQPSYEFYIKFIKS
jgi:hypothetical protein